MTDAICCARSSYFALSLALLRFWAVARASPRLRILPWLRLRPPSERLPCVSIAVHCLLNAVWSLHDPLLSLSHPRHVCRLLEICSTGPGDCTAAASLEPDTNMFWTFCGSHLASSGSSPPVFASVHPSRCSDHPVQGMEPVVLPQISAMSVCGGIMASHLCLHVNVHVHGLLL